MTYQKILFPALVSASLFLTGCVVRTYPLTRDRVDQDLTSGNRGFLMGSGPGEEKERKSTRKTRVVEIELGSPFKFESRPEMAERTAPASSQAVESDGYYVPEPSTDVIEPQAADTQTYESYTVQKGDTLQKISSKFFGTTKKWHKIYKANQVTMKSPDKLYPGQTIRIPVSAPSAGKQKIK